jgi:hypothetical protein
MSTYFGLTMVMVASQTLTGTWQDSDGSLPRWFVWIAVPARLGPGARRGSAGPPTLDAATVPPHGAPLYWVSAAKPGS